MAALTKQDVMTLLRQHQDRVKALGVRKLGLFGSFVRGEQHDGSDVDLLVEFHPDQKSFDNFMKLSFFLEDLLQRQVELVTREALSPYIGPHILDEVEYAQIST